jgi:hypothetical protein
VVGRPILLVVLLASCGGQPPAALEGPDPLDIDGSQRFDGLTIELQLDASTVEMEPGLELGSTLIVENHSGAAVTDPGCRIGAGRSALIRVDDPTPPAWIVPVVDCEGPLTMADGYRDRSAGPDFLAPVGADPLPPGDYIAVLKIPHRTGRLEQPLKVTW